jgi:hypothetical protein
MRLAPRLAWAVAPQPEPSSGNARVEMIAAPTRAVAVDARISPAFCASVVIATTSGSSVAQKTPSAVRSRSESTPR